MRRLRAALPALLLATLGFALLWYAPAILAFLLQPSSPSPSLPAAGSEPTAAAVDEILAGGLAGAGARLLAEEARGGVRHAVYQLPAGVAPLDVARDLRAAASGRGLEVYASPVDGLDAEVRAYAGPVLRQQLLLLPTLPPAPDAPPAPTLRERPLLAIVLAGLGGERVPWLAAEAIPLTVAIRPYAPFSLRLGQEAASAWHEVLVDLSGQPEVAGEREALAAAMGAVPFCTGVLSEVAPRAPLPVPFSVLVQPDSRGQAPPSVQGRWVPAQRSRRRPAAETLRRARLLAARDGAAAMVLDLDDPGLEEVLAWARREQGFRLALASELARPDQVRGVAVTPPEDAATTPR